MPDIGLAAKQYTIGGTRERSRSHAQVTADRITNKQAPFALGLARKAGLPDQTELGDFIGHELGVEAGLYEFGSGDASRLFFLTSPGAARTFY